MTAQATPPTMPSSRRRKPSALVADAIGDPIVVEAVAPTETPVNALTDCIAELREDPSFRAIEADLELSRQYAARIRERIAAGVEAILDIGRMLNEAKVKLAHGMFQEMVTEDLGGRLGPPNGSWRSLRTGFCQMRHMCRVCRRAGGPWPSWRA